MSQIRLWSRCEDKRAGSTILLRCRIGATAVALASLFAGGTAHAQTEIPPPAPEPAPPATAAPAPAPQPPAAPPPAAPPQPPPPAYDPSMQAGGLAPPPPMTQPPPPQSPPANNTEEKLDEAKEKDSERGLKWVWLNVGGGYEHVGLQTFNINEKNFTAGFIPSSSDGAVVSAGLGARLLFLTVGARGRLGFFPAWQVFSIGGELGFRFPIGRLEPYFDLGGGYTALGSFKDANSVKEATQAISIRGFDVRAGGGLDFFVTPIFSIGAAVSWEFLGLTRPGVDPTKIAEIKASPDYKSLQNAGQQAEADLLALDGSSYGSAFALMGMLGLHFP